MTKKYHRQRTRLGRYFQIAGNFLDSKTFFYLVLGIFVAQALWIALSGAYSMAYDEFFHLGIIQEYAKGLTPFIDQPAGPAELGSLARDPSFLYYYLMSFPYRIISSIWHTLMPQVIALRLINIALFVWGLVLYRKLLLRTGLSRRVVHIILFFFTLVPTVVMMAAQLTYDNLKFLMAGAALLIATNLVIALRERKTVTLTHILLLITILMAGSIVKYAFLPLALAIGGYVFIWFIIAFLRKQLNWRDMVTEFKANISRPKSLAVLFAFLFVGLLFAQRIGGNIIIYHTPVPDCGVVLSVEACKANAPYGRNEEYKQRNYPASVTHETKQKYPKYWYKKMLQEAFFVVGPRQFDYPIGEPLQTAYRAGKIILPILSLIILLGAVWLWRSSPIWQLFAITAIFYTGVLFYRNYTDYVQLGVPAAIHARYIICIVPLIAAMAAAVVVRYVRGWGRYIVYGVVTVLLGMIIMGGGWLPFVIRSADNWMWPHAMQTNNTVRSVLWHITPKDTPIFDERL